MGVLEALISAATLAGSSTSWPAELQKHNDCWTVCTSRADSATAPAYGNEKSGAAKAQRLLDSLHVKS
jgi:hypothetical protein